MTPASGNEERVLVLAPRGRDADVIAGVVSREAITCMPVPDLPALLVQIRAGAAAAVIAEEALTGGDTRPLAAWLAEQEPWSDFPIVLLLSKRSGRIDPALQLLIAALGNVILLERPLSAETLGSAAGSVLRARRRQYQAREVLVERQAATAQVAALNATLEAKVEERTRALAQANDRLTSEVIEREKAQQAMLQYQKMESLGRLTGGVAHDFNNLLNVVQGSMELILAVSSDETVRRRAQTAQAACVRGARLTTQLLAFARSQTLDLQPLAVQRLVESVTQLARPLLGADIELIVTIAPGADYILGDASQMEMALLNLVINAKDATAGRGRIVVRASRGKPPPELRDDIGYVCIAVSDNGSGMSPEVAAKVFEPFFTTKGVGKGTGLGLSQVYGMTQQSGGAARIESLQGEGTTVEIWLPAADAGETRPADDAVPQDAIAGSRLLVVEDDEFVRACMVDTLTALGCVVRQATNGDEAVRALDQDRPDLLLTDYLMPGMTGAELARSARERYPDLPVIVATGYADMEAIQASIGNGMVLRKPFQMAELGAAVGKALGAERDTLGHTSSTPS